MGGVETNEEKRPANPVGRGRQTAQKKKAKIGGTSS
jgi:hypothetical protein